YNRCHFYNPFDDSNLMLLLKIQTLQEPPIELLQLLCPSGEGPARGTKMGLLTRPARSWSRELI
ncbi:hypothetical protein, partial [Serratia marcescens]|uniref:hypothetical protein n=1 Tax=Serratia marcescens TaxID=615 RepID=UPI001C982BD1